MSSEPLSSAPPTSATAAPRRVWPWVLGSLGLLFVLASAVIALRLSRDQTLPPPPYDERTLGPIPAAMGTWDVLAREQARFRGEAPGPPELHDRFAHDRTDEELVLDREAIAVELSEIDRGTLDALVPLLEAIYTGAPMLDRCGDARGQMGLECPALAVMRAEQSAEVVILSRWLDEEDERAASLLARVLVASLGLAASGRSVIGQLVALSALSRAVGLSLALSRAGLPITGELEAALARVVRDDVDLGRGWVGEVLLADRALHLLGDANVLERIFFDRADAARRVFASQEACVRYARDPSAPAPPAVAVPTTETDPSLSDATSIAFVEAMLVDCEEPIDRGRSQLETARRRARMLTAR